MRRRPDTCFAVDRAGQEFDHVAWHLAGAEAAQTMFEDSAAQIDVGGLDIGDQATKDGIWNLIRLL